MTHETLHQPSHDHEHAAGGRSAGIPARRLAAVELWLTKLETYLEGHTIDELRGLLDSHGLVPAAAAGQGGLLLSRGDEREIHWTTSAAAWRS